MPLHKFDFESNRIPKIETKELKRRISLAFPCVVSNDYDYNHNTRKILVEKYKNSLPSGSYTKHLIKIKTPDPKQSFMWDWKEDKLIGLITHSGISVRDKPALSPGSWYLKRIYERVGEFTTLHSCGHPMLFKPSVEEVLAQLPAELFDEEKLAGRRLYYTTNILNNNNFSETSMLSSTYHIAKTIVYIEIIY